jgi:DNA-binding transcriptional LysR family regulator
MFGLRLKCVVQGMFEKLLSKRGLSFERLRVIVELDEAGSVVKAAGGDTTRQSQYSRQLGQLEDFFGVELTRRDGKKLVLTDAGKRLAEITRESLFSLEHFQAGYQNAPVTIKLGAGDSLLQWLLLPRVERLLKKLPEVSISLRNLRTRETVECLCDLTLDLGLLRDSGVSPKLKSARILRLAYAIFVPRKLLVGKGRVDHRWALEHLPIATYTGDGQFAKSVAQAIQAAGIKLNSRIECETFPQAHRAVQSGSYAAILPSIAGADLDESDFLRIEAPFLKSHERMICLAWNPRMLRVRPGFEKVIACFRDILSAAV